MKKEFQLIKITKNYQITLPSRLRKGFKLKEGDYLEARMEDGAFVFSPKKMVDIVPHQAWFWDEEWQKGERKADKDIKSGKIKTFDNVDDFGKELDSISG